MLTWAASSPGWNDRIVMASPTVLRLQLLAACIFFDWPGYVYALSAPGPHYEPRLSQRGKPTSHFRPPALCSSSSTSAFDASEGWAPARVVARAPAALARAIASSIPYSSARATARAPLNASPAAVAS